MNADQRASVAVRGITLDADAVRAQLQDSVQSQSLTLAQLDALENLSDDAINELIQSNATLNSVFWEMHDEIRQQTIEQLLHQIRQLS